MSHVDIGDKEILAAYNEVVDAKNPTNWFLMTYAGKTDVLKLAEKGTDGLKGLVDELNEGKVMYGLLRVNDPKSGLPKHVFITWCPDGVPSNRKAMVNSHTSDVAKFLKHFHCQINARADGDLAEKYVMAEVAKAGGAFYSVHAKEETKDVYTSHPEEKEQPKQQSSQHDKSIKADTGALKSKFSGQPQPAEEKPAPKPAPGKLANRPVQPVEEEPKPAPKPVEKPKPAEPAKPVEKPKPVEQPKPEPPKPIEQPKPVKKEPEPEPEQTWEEEQPAPVEEQPAYEEQPAEQAYEEQPAEQAYEEQPAEQAYEEQPAEQPVEQQYEEQPAEEQPAEEQPAEEQPAEEQQYVYATVLESYEAASESEISINAGDTVVVLQQLDQGWWEGYVYNPDEQTPQGWFPSDFVQLIQ